MIKALIVDDEKNCSEALQILLQENCPGVTVIGVAHSGMEALAMIEAHQPQLVFLDIEMPHMTGFQVLERLPRINFELIFTTSYDQYAIKAFKFSALDYLLKPIDREELERAVAKVTEKLAAVLPQQLAILLQKINQPSLSAQRIALPTLQGLEMVPVSAIIRCAANSNYTEFYLTGKRKILVSRTLKEAEEMLEEYGFLRVHHSHLVNLNEAVRYAKGEGGYLVMSDGTTVDVSRSRKELLLQRLQVFKS